MTQREVYDHLLKEITDRLIWQMCTPNSPDDFIEIAERKAIITTVQQTWYWYNHQEEFISKCFFPVIAKPQKE